MKRPSATSLVLFGFSLGLFASANAGSLGSAVFPDVPNGSYFDSAVGEMYADGIITGYQDGRFGPNDYVTRGQIAVMLQRFKNGGVAVSSSSSSRSRVSSSSSSSTSTTSSSSSSQVATTDAGSFRFTTGSFKADEDGGVATVNVIRYGGNAGAVSVHYETEDSTASGGSDFDVTSGTLTFEAGKTSGSFEIPITNDNEAEGNEAFFVHLVDPTGGATLGTPVTATVTIVDDDEGAGTSADPENSKGVFVFSAAEYRIGEDMDTVTITIERKGTSGSAAVQYEAKNGTADGNNYDSIPATSVTFGDGESTKTFTVNIVDNNTINGNKTVNLRLLSPTNGATLGSLSTSTLIIVDDEVSSFEAGEISVESNEYTVSEGESVVIAITRHGGALGEVSVDYATQNTLAKAGEDYTETSGTLTFKQGETKKLISIPTIDDNKNDPNEVFKLNLSNPTGGASLGSPTSATITIN